MIVEGFDVSDVVDRFRPIMRPPERMSLDDTGFASRCCWASARIGRLLGFGIRRLVQFTGEVERLAGVCTKAGHEIDTEDLSQRAAVVAALYRHLRFPVLHDDHDEINRGMGWSNEPGSGGTEPASHSSPTPFVQPFSETAKYVKESHRALGHAIRAVVFELGLRRDRLRDAARQNDGLRATLRNVREDGDLVREFLHDLVIAAECAMAEDEGVDHEDVDKLRSALGDISFILGQVGEGVQAMASVAASVLDEPDPRSAPENNDGVTNATVPDPVKDKGGKKNGRNGKRK